MRWPRLEHCWPNRVWARCRPSRLTTRWWPRSKRCSNTAARWSACAPWRFITSRISWPSSQPRSADQLGTHGKIESRLRRLENIDLTAVDTAAGAYRLGWLAEVPRRPGPVLATPDQGSRGRPDRAPRRARNNLRDEPGVGAVVAATFLTEVGDPRRGSLPKPSSPRWCGTGAVALSSGEGNGQPARHRLGLRRQPTGQQHASTCASVTQQRYNDAAQAYLGRKLAEGKTRRRGRAEPTSGTSPIASFAACGGDERARRQPSLLTR